MKHSNQLKHLNNLTHWRKNTFSVKIQRDECHQAPDISANENLVFHLHNGLEDY